VTVLLVEAGQVAAAEAVIPAGHWMVGGSVSFTLTVNEQLAVSPDVSVAVQLTVVAPTTKVEPLGGEQTTPATPQLSDTLGEG